MKQLIKSAGRSSPAFLFDSAGLHPAVKILALILMTVSIPLISFNGLAILFLLLSIGLIRFRVNRFLKMMLRMRWLFLSIWLIYAFTTPGEYLHGLPIDLMPTYEGLRVGFMQIFRIAMVLAGVSILMASATQEKLMVGIYHLLRPLGVLGIRCERFTARLYLTLKYIENANPQSSMPLISLGWHHRFEALLDDATKLAKLEIIHLENMPFSKLDYLCLAFMLVLLGALLGVSVGVLR